ncbi:MAG: PIN domain-containing protein [Burkholderiaceae bacterium]
MIPNRVVLDTNVCLDLFVFFDPRWAVLRAALDMGKVTAVTRQDCRTEWTLVLNYAKFGLSAERRSACLAEFDSLICCVPPTSVDSMCDDSWPVEPRAVVPLPRCRDADDQKFLETARDCSAAVLITKDKALLKLAARCRRAGLFDIQDPKTWTSTLF